jgi:hypothetical protein
MSLLHFYVDGVLPSHVYTHEQDTAMEELGTKVAFHFIKQLLQY